MSEPHKSKPLTGPVETPGKRAASEAAYMKWMAAESAGRELLTKGRVDPTGDPDEEDDDERGDAFDPKQPRGSSGLLSHHKATAVGLAAFTMGDAAGDDADAHHEAATAHGHAALEFRLLSQRHAMMGNAGAAKRHEASADEHMQQATQHTMTANEIFARKQAQEAGSLPTANDQAGNQTPP
jgi:hypothetical protein